MLPSQMKFRCRTLNEVRREVRQGGDFSCELFSHINECNVCMQRVAIVARELRESKESPTVGRAAVGVLENLKSMSEKRADPIRKLQAYKDVLDTSLSLEQRTQALELINAAMMYAAAWE